jgi:hypothetical protein
MKFCEYCGRPFRQREAFQRFCGLECSRAFHTQERKQATDWFRRHKMMVETPATRREAAE